MTTWTRQDDDAALREGWFISNSSEGCDEIQRHPGSEIFPGDAEAIAHVYWKAGTGSDLHRRAIAHTLRDGNSWAYERPLRKYKATAEEVEMTGDSNVELLPLPAHFAHQHDNVKKIVRDYTRANVAHATAAKDAEIDALRTRLEDTVRDSTNKIEALRAEVNTAKGQAEFYRTERNKNQQKAERLAEALRFYADTNNWIGRFVTDPTTPAEEDGGDNARSALRDHDQERNDG